VGALTASCCHGFCFFSHARAFFVSDRSLMEFGYLGQTGIVGGWPGEEEYPPQPMVTQTAGFFDRYAEAGGSVERKVMPGGHMCALEHPETFVTILKEFL
jgi:hypothetical protein